MNKPIDASTAHAAEDDLFTLEAFLKRGTPIEGIFTAPTSSQVMPAGGPNVIGLVGSLNVQGFALGQCLDFHHEVSKLLEVQVENESHLSLEPQRWLSDYFDLNAIELVELTEATVHVASPNDPQGLSFQYLPTGHGEPEMEEKRNIFLIPTDLPMGLQLTAAGDILQMYAKKDEAQGLLQWDRYIDGSLTVNMSFNCYASYTLKKDPEAREGFLKELLKLSLVSGPDFGVTYHAWLRLVGLTGSRFVANDPYGVHPPAARFGFNVSHDMAGYGRSSFFTDFNRPSRRMSLPFDQVEARRRASFRSLRSYGRGE